MEKVKLGKTDLNVARINLAGNVFGWTLNGQQSFGILDAFTRAGFNFINTADSYSWWMDGNVGSESENDLNKSVQGKDARKYLNEKSLAVLAALDKVSDKHQSKPATMALAWLLAQPHIAAPIVSATSQSQLETLFAVPQLSLDAEDLAILNNVNK